MSTMFDFAGYYEQVAKQMPEECRVCEIGVADGESALYLAKALHRLNKSFKLFMIDNMDYGKYVQMKTIYENIIKSGLGEYIEVIPYDSAQASKLFNDGFLDFIFLDSSHEYWETRDSIKAWYPKIKDGGILAGHDYILYPEVKLAVDELIPHVIIREQIHDYPFEPEQFLHVEGTDRGYGLWHCTKDFYKFLT